MDHVEREWEERDLRSAFFPVERCPMTYAMPGTNKFGSVSGYKALVDTTTGKTLSTVSDRYKLITNEEAYRLTAPIVKGFFGGDGLDDFGCFNILMPNSKAQCRIDLTRSKKRSQGFSPVLGDRWTAFVRISNSYNRTTRLRIQIGFCRWICLNGMIFGARSFTLELNHTDRILRDPKFAEKITEKALGEVGDLATSEKNFADTLEPLPGITMTPDDMKALFFHAYGMGYTEQSVRDMTDKQYENLLVFRERLDGLVASYADEFGPNAYAAFNVMTDYASFPHKNRQHAILTPGYQSRVGAWLGGFSSAAKQSDFSLASYLTPGDIATVRVVKDVERIRNHATK